MSFHKRVKMKNYTAELLAKRPAEYAAQFQDMESKIKLLELQLDNAYLALTAVLASGLLEPDAEEMVRLGLENKPQAENTRLG